MVSSACRVTLVGGVSGAGKTTAARALAAAMRAQVLSVDDVRVALEATACGAVRDAFLTARAAPFATSVSHDSVDEAWRTVSHHVSNAIRPVILMRIAYGDRLVVEGDTLLPSLMLTPTLRQLAARGVVSMVVLTVASQVGLAARLRERDRGFSQFDAIQQQFEIDRLWRHASWLGEQASRAGVATVSLPTDNGGTGCVQLIQRALGSRTGGV